ncbi:MAG: hypothetical protein U0271_47275 [Polyangiaceae bacterium]
MRSLSVQILSFSLVGAVLAAGLLVGQACKIRTTGGSSGGGEGGAGGSDGGGGSSSSEGGASCRDLTDCDQCRQCAANGPCQDEISACLNDPGCAGIDQCISLCDGTPADCWETCRAQDPASAELYDPARACLDCFECGQACYAPYVCGG